MRHFVAYILFPTYSSYDYMYNYRKGWESQTAAIVCKLRLFTESTMSYILCFALSARIGLWTSREMPPQPWFQQFQKLWQPCSWAPDSRTFVLVWTLSGLPFQPHFLPRCHQEHCSTAPGNSRTFADPCWYVPGGLLQQEVLIFIYWKKRRTEIPYCVILHTQHTLIHSFFHVLCRVQELNCKRLKGYRLPPYLPCKLQCSVHTDSDPWVTIAM